MLCVGAVRIGPARQSFWAIWDREGERLHERTRLGRGGVRMLCGTVDVEDTAPDGPVEIRVRLSETDGVETISASGADYGWTRKQAPVPARVELRIGVRRLRFEAAAVIDDTSAYYERHTQWLWSAGVGTLRDGRPAAWNLVSGVHDAARGSERTVWVGDQPHEVGPARFDPGLDGVAFGHGAGDGGQLRFAAEATREANENRLIVRSRYRQPFGTFAGTLGTGLELAEAFGVMEEHDVYW
jgi:hypothetical protein